MAYIRPLPELSPPPSASLEMYWAFEQLERIRSAIELLNQDIETVVGTDLGALQAQVDQLQSDFDALVLTVNSQGSSITSILADITTIQSDIIALQQDVTDLATDKLGAILAGSTVGWRDNLSQVIVRGSGANNPTWTAFRGNIFAYEFPGTASNMREFWTTFHIDHDYKPGSTIYPHVHFAVGNTTATGTVKWFMEYTIAKGHQQSSGSVFAAPVTVSQTIAIDGTAYKHYVCELAAGITDANIEPDSLLLFRFYRDAGDVQDTFTNSVWGFMSDLHYQFDRYGTKNRAPNFYA